MGKKKENKFAELVEAVECFIAAHEMRNHHYLPDDKIIIAFSYEKKKHVKRAIKQLR